MIYRRSTLSNVGFASFKVKTRNIRVNLFPEYWVFRGNILKHEIIPFINCNFFYISFCCNLTITTQLEGQILVA